MIDLDFAAIERRLAGRLGVDVDNVTSFDQLYRPPATIASVSEVETGVPELWYCVTCDRFYPVGASCEHVDVSIRTPLDDLRGWWTRRRLAAQARRLDRLRRELEDDVRRDR